MNKGLIVSLVIITLLSLVITFFAPISEMYKGIASLPSIGALFAGLFQILRDNETHARRLKLQEEQQIFDLGATSHMANTAFDKHVEFCEKYLSKVHELVVTLTREGPTENAFKHADELYTLRVEYAAWVTPEIEEKLIPFEQAVRRMGANADLVRSLRNEEDNQGVRSQAVTDMYNIFRSVMDFENVDDVDERATVKVVKEQVREILKISDLVKVREFLIRKATDVAVNTKS